jgi:outer membrane protein assembly factor BamB
MEVMKMMARIYRAIAVAFVAPAILAGVAGAASPEALENWPQWRGPLCTGVAPLANPPLRWSESENIKWKVKVPGSGLASPIVWGDKVFVQSAVPTDRKAEGTLVTADSTAPADPAAKRDRMRTPKPEVFYQFVLICLNRQTGEELWRRVCREEVPHEGHHPDHGFASYSPVTDGQHVIAHFGSRGLYCCDFQGKLQWQKDLGKMTTSNTFGEASSPALFENTIVVIWDQIGDDFIAAFDKRTGAELWRTAREEEDTNWSTPLVVQHAGKPQAVTTASGKIRSYDLADGKPIWECSGMTECAIPTPVALDNIVYVMSGFRGSNLLAIKLGQTGDLTNSDAISWSYGKDTPYVPSPLLYDRRLYFFKGNNPIISAFNIDGGTPVFGPQRLEEAKGVYASPVGAAGRVYFICRNGFTFVVQHADQFMVLGTNKLDDELNATPAVVGNEIFLRGKEHLYCIAEKSK